MTNIPANVVNNNALLIPDNKFWDSSWSTENTLFVHLNNDPRILHPAVLTHHNSLLVGRLLHGYLLYFNPITLSLEPGLCTGLPQASEDGLQYSYELRPDLYWDDKTPVTVDDVIFSFKAYKCPLTDNPVHKPYVENLAEVVADPRQPRRFHFRSKERYVLDKSFVIEFPILPQHFYDSARVLQRYTFQQFDDPGFNADQHADLVQWSRSFNDPKRATDPQFMMGLGAYRLEKWERDQFLVLRKKEAHWTYGLDSVPLLARSHPEKIVFRILRDETAAKLELMRQQLDVSGSLSTRTVNDLMADSSFRNNFNTVFQENYGSNRIYLNLRPDGVQRLPFFTDVRVRRAMAYLVPVDRMIDVLSMGQATRWTSFVPPFRTDILDTTLKPIPYDVSAAIALLEAAGWHDTDQDGVRDKIINGRRVALEPELSMGALGPTSRDLAATLYEAALPAGVRLKFRELEQATLLEKVRQHDFDMLLMGSISSALAKDYTQILHTRSWEQNGSNYSGFGDARTDALLDSMRRELNDSLYTSMLKRLQRIVYEQQPIIFIHAPYRKVIIHKRWGNQIYIKELPGFVPNALRLLFARNS